MTNSTTLSSTAIWRLRLFLSAILVLTGAFCLKTGFQRTYSICETTAGDPLGLSYSGLYWFMGWALCLGYAQARLLKVTITHQLQRWKHPDLNWYAILFGSNDRIPIFMGVGLVFALIVSTPTASPPLLDAFLHLMLGFYFMFSASYWWQDVKSPESSNS